MAEIGLSKLQAVNRILRAVDQGAVSALDPGGSSEAADAERVLDDQIEILQAQGWPFNTNKGEAHTASGGGNTINFGSDTLAVRCIAPGRYMDNIQLRGDEAYIVTEATNDFGSALTIYVDRIVEVAWASCDTNFKNLAIAHAVQEFRRRKQFDAQLDAALTQEVAVAEQKATRNDPKPDPTPNTNPSLLIGGERR